ncbi:hypothetical protein ACFQ51_47295 [Streptomyces kaempferi]
MERALARYIGRREQMRDTVEDVADLLSDQQSSSFSPGTAEANSAPDRLTAYRVRTR